MYLKSIHRLYYSFRIDSPSQETHTKRKHTSQKPIRSPKDGNSLNKNPIDLAPNLRKKHVYTVVHTVL